MDGDAAPPVSDAADPAAWVGRTRTRREVLDHGAVARLAMVLDLAAPPGPAGAVPEGWHWPLFLPRARQSEIGPDGHPRRGSFLPPVPLPRRMFAGSRLTFADQLRTGEPCELTERIAAIDEKSGRSGPLVFVEVERIFAQDGLARVTETQSLVFRPMAAPGEAGAEGPSAPEGADWRDEIACDAATLFRFSAVTFNSHRIHYDRDYAMRVENYPGLVVHGPLIALFLLEAARRRGGGARCAAFAFKAVRPLFDHAPFFACGRLSGGEATLWAADGHGRLAMSATAEFG